MYPVGQAAGWLTVVEHRILEYVVEVDRQRGINRLWREAGVEEQEVVCMATDKGFEQPIHFDSERRDFLGITTTVVGAVGVCGAAVPFISSMNPSKDVKAKATSLVDIASIPLGKTHIVEWQGKPVFIMHRTPETIAAMQASQPDLDPQSDKDRVQKAEWLVVVGLCTHLGCVPNQTKDGWICPCHGSLYDNSGRVTRGPAPTNLEVPYYEFVDDHTIIIGKVV